MNVLIDWVGLEQLDSSDEAYSKGYISSKQCIWSLNETKWVTIIFSPRIEWNTRTIDINHYFGKFQLG